MTHVKRRVLAVTTLGTTRVKQPPGLSGRAAAKLQDVSWPELAYDGPRTLRKQLVFHPCDMMLGRVTDRIEDRGATDVNRSRWAVATGAGKGAPG